MYKHGEAGYDYFNASTGTVIMLKAGFQEDKDYIIPESVKLILFGKKLIPTSFDERGNPRIDGAAKQKLIWEIRQRIREGKLKSEHDVLIGYSYTTTDGRSIKIPIKKRIPRSDVCPICGEEFELSDFGDNGIVELDGCYCLAHRKCANDFYRLKAFDEIAETVYSAFLTYFMGKEDGFVWKNVMKYVAPTESTRYCSSRSCLMFHTLIGDIKVYCLTHSYYIRWMDSFSPFDPSALGLKKADNQYSNLASIRIIKADSIEKICKYLSLSIRDVLEK
jgi:hypothetical protein